MQNDEAYLLFYSRKKTLKQDTRNGKDAEKTARDSHTKLPNGTQTPVPAPAPPLGPEQKSRPEPPVKPQNQRLAALLTQTPEPAKQGLPAAHSRPELRAAQPAEAPRSHQSQRPQTDPTEELMSQLFGSSEKPPAEKLPERPVWYDVQGSGCVSLGKRPPDASSQRSRQSVAPKIKRCPVPGLRHLKLMVQRTRLDQRLPSEPVLRRATTTEVPGSDNELGLGSAPLEAVLERSRSLDFTG